MVALDWSGRREAPCAARESRLAPVSSRPPINRTLGFPQSGWKRAHIRSRIPHRVRGDGLLDQPSCRRQLARWLPPSPSPQDLTMRRAAVPALRPGA